MVSAAILALQLAASASPAPATSSLKQIIDVRARPFCATLTQRVEPAVAGLIKNDALIEHGRGGLLKTGADAVADARAAAMDKRALRDVGLAMSHNVAAVDGILDDPARFPAVAKSDDERVAAAIKTQLLAILTRQKLVADAILGTVETGGFGQMRTQFPAGNVAMPQTVNPTAVAQPGSGPGGLAAAAPLADPHAISLPALMDSDIAGRTIYDKLAALIESHQAASRAIEATAGDAIVRAAASCGGTPLP